MRKTKSAIKYGMETLKLSSDELFKLIESSKDYVGSDYKRWLARKIIELAEKDGIGYSQLLVKKFNIINSIMEEVAETDSIKEEFLDIFKSTLKGELYSNGFPYLGTELEVDWGKGIDYDKNNSFFVMNAFSDGLRDSVVGESDKEVSLIIRLSNETVNKKCELYSDAKSRGIVINSAGGLILYRLCCLAEVFPMERVTIGVYCQAGFLYSEGNKDIVETFLSYYKIIDGFSMKSIELSSGGINSGTMAWLTARPIKDIDEADDCIELKSITLDEEELLGYREVDTKRYSRSREIMLSSILGEEPEGALGYLFKKGGLQLCTENITGEGIPITKNNLEDVIAYFGVTRSKELEWGFDEDIPCLINGSDSYQELLWNCLPLFLYDYRSGFECGSALSVDSSIMKGILEKAMPYFSFEAKELFYLCKEFTEYVGQGTDLVGKSFKEIRKEANSENFNIAYEFKLTSLKEYINGMSKSFM